MYHFRKIFDFDVGLMKARCVIVKYIHSGATVIINCTFIIKVLFENVTLYVVAKLLILFASKDIMNK